MANAEDNIGNQILPNPKKVLFAEGLVNYIFQTYLLPGTLFSTQRQSEIGVRIFDNNLRLSIDFISNASGYEIEQTYNFIMGNKLNYAPWFAHYANTIKSKFFRRGFDTESFLRYSVYLTHLAVKLYAQGINEAPRMAVHYIAEVIDLDLFGCETIKLDPSTEIRRLGIDMLKQSSPYRKDEPLEANYHDLIPEDQQLRIDMLKQSTLYGEEKSFIQDTKDKYARRKHILNRCEVTTGNIHGEAFNNEKNDEDKATNFYCSLCHSQSYSAFEKKQKSFDPQTRKQNIVSSLGYIGGPVSSCRHLFTQECDSSDSNDYENRLQKRKLFDPQNGKPYNMAPSGYVGVPGSSHTQECYSLYSSNRQLKKPRFADDT